MFYWWRARRGGAKVGVAGCCGGPALAIFITVEVVTVFATIAVNTYHGDRPTKRLLAYMLLVAILGWLFAMVAGAYTNG